MYNSQMETTDYYQREVRQNHPEILDEWVQRVLDNPYYTEQQDDGRIRYYGFVPELDHWIRVIVADGKLHNRFIDHNKRRFGGDHETESSYFKDTDTLWLSNELPTPVGEDITENLGETMKLKVSYFKDTDTLWLSNELPTPVGEDITENVTVFFDMEKTQPNGVLIEHAAELLLPLFYWPLRKHKKMQTINRATRPQRLLPNVSRRNSWRPSRN